MPRSGAGWTLADAPRLDDKTAIVTRANSGLGLETARDSPGWGLPSYSLVVTSTPRRPRPMTSPAPSLMPGSDRAPGSEATSNRCAGRPI